MRQQNIRSFAQFRLNPAMRGAFAYIRVLVSIVFLTLLTFYIVKSLGLNKGQPAGYDAMGHVSEVRFVAKNFPNILWNPYWYSGMVFFPSAYPPIYPIGLGLISKYFNILPEILVRNASVFSMFAIVIGILITIYTFSKKVLLALVSALLVISTPAFWSYILQMGLQIRLFGFAVYLLMLAVLTVYLTARDKIKKYILPFLIISILVSILSHSLGAVLSLLTIPVFVLMFGARKRLILKLMLIPLGLAGFYYVPYLILHPGFVTSITPFTGDPFYAPILVRELFKVEYMGLGVILIPLTTLLFILLWIIKTEDNNKTKIPFYFFAVLGGLLILYALGFFKIQIIALYTSHVLFMAALFFTLAIGFGIGYLGEKVISKKLLLIAVFAVAALSLTNLRILKTKLIENNRPILREEGANNFNYRFSTVNEGLAASLNTKNDLFQTGGYFVQGLLNPDFQYWYDWAVFRGNNNLAETKFLLNWYAVNDVYLGTANQELFKQMAFAKFDKNLDYVRNGQGFSLNNPSPILVGSNIKPIPINVSEINSYAGKKGLDKLTGDWQGLKVIMINPQKWAAEINGSYRYLIFKENYFPNWHSYLTTAKDLTGGSGVELPISKVGPGLMSVDLQSISNDELLMINGATSIGGGGKWVIFEYKAGWPEYLGLFTTLGTLFGLLIYQIVRIIANTKRIKSNELIVKIRTFVKIRLRPYGRIR